MTPEDDYDFDAIDFVRAHVYAHFDPVQMMPDEYEMKIWKAVATALRQAASAAVQQERERCAAIARKYAEQNRKAVIDCRKRANRLGNDIFGHGEMAHEGAVECEAAMHEATAIADAIEAQ